MIKNTKPDDFEKVKVDFVTASYKDEDSIYKRLKKILKCCDKVFRGGSISDSRIANYFAQVSTRRMRKRVRRGSR